MPHPLPANLHFVSPSAIKRQQLRNSFRGYELKPDLIYRLMFANGQVRTANSCVLWEYDVLCNWQGVDQFGGEHRLTIEFDLKFDGTDGRDEMHFGGFNNDLIALFDNEELVI